MLNLVCLSSSPAVGRATAAGIAGSTGSVASETNHERRPQQSRKGTMLALMALCSLLSADLGAAFISTPGSSLCSFQPLVSTVHKKVFTGMSRTVVAAKSKGKSKAPGGAAKGFGAPKDSPLVQSLFSSCTSSIALLSVLSLSNQLVIQKK